MLIEFSVKNYKSVWEQQTLSMTAGNAIKDLQDSNVFDTPIKGLLKLLKSAVIWGPNGAGKSNLISALGFMQRFVLDSSRHGQDGDTINRFPFRLNSQGLSESTELEIFFIQDEVRYQYGFACNEARVTGEWLLAYPESRPQRWFERSFDSKTGEEAWSLGNKLAGNKKTWKENTRPNALFLSVAVQLNSEQLKPVFAWFKKLMIIGHGVNVDPGFTIEQCEEETVRNTVLAFMKGADVNLDGIRIKTDKLSTDKIKMPDNVPGELKKKIATDLNGTGFKQVEFIHKMNDSEQTTSFKLEDESAGTQKIFAYAGPWLDLLTNGRVLIVDELNNSFHPHMIRFLLRMIHNRVSNKANGQLVFSTHDTSILDLKILRWDQIWFVEKDNASATQLYSLSDFHPCKRDALEKGYLQGRYGALPYIGEVGF